MIVIGKIENKFIITFFSFILILIIGFIDYITGAELASSIFYVIPILFVALYKNSQKTFVIFNAVFATFVWFFADFLARDYPDYFVSIWNSLVRLSFFLITGLLALNLKEKYKKLNQLNNKLQILNQEKNKFIGIAAHDLRNPIGTISGFSDFIISHYSHKIDAEVFEMVNYIKESSNNTLELLQNLLDISKIESGIIEISLKLQDYIKFIKKQIYFNQIIARKKEIKINLEANEEEIIFLFDQQYLSQVINNLLTNAVKFSYQKSEVLVRISVTENNFIKTEVIDNGKGIPLEEQSKLFKYFQKTSTQPTAGEKSTGLGLAIAKKIIIEHHGHIGLVSEINKGSNFYFELPRQ